jgi:uncharacterized protein YgiM (DUF1202 family)
MNRFVNIGKHALGILLGGFLFACVSVTAFADGKVTVSVDSVFVRATASTSAAIVGGALNGESFDVISSETDSNGYTWYKIKLTDGTVGYVRGDLVSASGVTAENNTTNTSETGSGDASALTEVEPIGAYVTDDVNVRSGASTSDTIVTQAKANTAVSVTAYEKAGDGKTWYSVSFSDSNGAQVSGFIREDFIRLDGELTEKKDEPETVEEVTEEVPEETEEIVYNDYEAVYSADDDTWYLNNYIAGTKTKITDLLSAADLYNAAVDEYEGKLKTKNIIIGVLIAVIIALIGLGVYAYISVRRWYYGTDEDDEEPVKETKTVTRKTEKTEPARTHTTSSVRMQTVGAESLKTAEKPAAKSSNVLTGVRLPDGSIRMADGSIRKARVGVKLPDGSIKFEDGSTRKPDGTMVKPETHTAEIPKVTRTGVSEATVREVKYTHTSEVDSDDDMEYGFLDMDKNTDMQ